MPKISKVILISSLTICSYFLCSLHLPISAYPNYSFGNNGRRGESGGDRTIFANGSPVSIDIAGEDGRWGQDGDSGKNAHCRDRQGEDGKSDKSPKHGKNGDFGGNGDDGGNGDFLSVYYQNLGDIRQIYVYAAGGRGGYGCNDGRKGSHGSDGVRGRQGAVGKLYIINGNERLPQDKPKQEVRVVDLIDKPIEVSLNIWKTRQGASELLAPGSVIDDIYQEFD